MMSSNTSDPAIQPADASAASASEKVETQGGGDTPNVPSIENLKSQAKKAIETDPAASAVVPATADSAVQAPAAASAYSPNFKYKAFGKDYEIEEFWRPLIKDAESEKMVKDIFTRTHAFDDLKSKSDVTQREFHNLLEDHQALDKDVRRVMTFFKNKDFGNAFAALRISREDIFDYVQRELDHMNLPPEQRRQIETQSQERQRLYEMEQANEHLQQQYQQQSVQARNVQLDMVLSRPDVANTASVIDQRLGHIGAFRDLVIEEAQKVYYSTGQDISAEQAANLVLQKYGKLVAVEDARAQVPMQAPVPQVQAKPVIPSVQGRGTSPVKKVPKSLEDLKALAKEFQASGS